MGISDKSKIQKISMLALGLLIDIIERISNIVLRRDERSQPVFKELDEDTPGFEGILPISENASDTWDEQAGQVASDLYPTDDVVSDDVDSEPSYTGNPEEVISDDFMGDTKEYWQDQLDPSTEEDIPLRPSEVNIPHEIQYDQEDDLQIITPGQDESEVVIPEEDIEVINPEKKEIDSETFSGNNKMRGKNKNK